MNKNKKSLAVLSSAALGVLIASAVTTNAHAAVTDYVAKNAANNVISFNLDKLLADYTNKLSGQASPMFDEYLKDAPNLVAFKDTIKGYVSYDAVSKAYTDALIKDGGKTFKLDAVTENAAATDIANVTVDSTCGTDGKVVSVDPTKTIKTVSPITVPATTVGVAPTLPTTVSVTLLDGTTKTANITWNAAATTAATYATAGTVTVNGTLADYNNQVVSASVTVNAAATNLAVQSVTAVNSKTIAVTFTKAVDIASAQTTSNYSIVGVNSDAVSGALTIDSAKLQDDKQTVYLTLNDATPLNNTSTAQYLVKVTKNVLGTDGTAVPAYGSLVNLADAAVPTVTGITYPDSNTIKVAFSEPINTTSAGIASATTIQKNGTTVAVSSGAFVLASDKMSFTINDTTAGFTRAVDYSIAITGLSDFAGNSLTKYAGTFNVATDTVAPTVSSLTSLDTKHLKVTFSKPLKPQTLGGTNYFTVKEDGTALAVGTTASQTPKQYTISNYNTTTPDYQTFVVNFADARTNGDNHIYTVANFQDVIGNPSSPASSTYTQQVQIIGTKPVISNTVGSLKNIAGTYYIVYDFDRDVSIGSGTITGTYVDSTGVTKNVSGLGTITPVAHSTLTQLATNEIAIPVTNIVTGNYSITLPSTLVVDTYANSIDTTKATFNYSASVLPTAVTNVWLNGVTSAVPSYTANSSTTSNTTTTNEIVVQFASEVGSDSLDVSHYTVDGVNVFKSAIFDGSKNTVRLTLNDGAITSTAVRTLKISGIQNVTDKTISITDFVANKVKENVAPTVSKVELTGLNTVKVTFSEDVKDLSVNSTNSGTLIDANNFEVRVNGSVASVSGAQENNGVAVLTLTTPLTSVTTPVTVSVLGTNDVTDLAGNVLAATTTPISATTALSDAKGQADASLTAAKAQFATATTLATSCTAASARSAYNDAVAAVDAAGLHGTNTVTGGSDTYDQELADLLGKVTYQETVYFASTYDLSVKSNYDTLYTGSSSLVTVATTAKTAMNDATAKGLVNTALTTLGTTEKGYIDHIQTAITALNTASTTNTGANLAAALTAVTTADTDMTAWSAPVSSVTKTTLSTNYTAGKALITTAKANIVLSKDSADTTNKTVKATWGSDNTSLALSNLVLTATPANITNGITAMAVSGTGVVSATGTATAAVNFTVTATLASPFTAVEQTTQATGSVANGAAVVTLN